MVVCYQVWQSSFRDGELIKAKIGWANPKTYDPSYILFTFGDMSWTLEPMVAWRIKQK